MFRKTFAVASLVVLAAAGCSSEDSAEPDDASSESTDEESSASAPASSSSPEPSAPQTTANPANIGAGALELGGTRDGLYMDTTLLEVERPMVASNPYITPDAEGHEWVGLNVRACAGDDSPEPLEVGWFDWSLQDQSDGLYPASSSSWDDFPSPQYPTYGTVPAGSCVAGWLLVSVPVGTDLRSAVLVGGEGAPVAEWLL